MMAVGDLVIHGMLFHRYDFTQTGFIYNNIKDWYSTSRKGNRSTRPRSDGDLRVRRFYQNGVKVTVSGLFISDDAAVVALAKAQLGALDNEGMEVQVLLTDAYNTTSRTMQIMSVSIPHTADQFAFSFTIDLSSADANRYGPEQSRSTGPAQLSPTAGLIFPLGGVDVPFLNWGEESTSNGRLTIVNDGERTSWPDLYIDGGMSGGFIISVIETGQVLRLDRMVPIGSTVYLNQKTRRAIIDDQSDVGGQMTRTDWFSIPKHESRTLQFTPLGTTSGQPLLTARNRPTY